MTDHSPRPDSPSLVIAIDGPAGAGKSTIARRLAQRLGLPYLDTGAMYRAMGLLARREGIEPPFDQAARERLATMAREHSIEFVPDRTCGRLLIDGEDVSDAIRSPECAAAASSVSAVPEVRRALVPLQRRLGQQAGGVMEGRDIGSVVFPDAALKVFLTASAEERARRRFHDLRERRVSISLEEVSRQQHERDRQDTSRADSPLHVARGSVVVDTTGMTPDEVVERLVDELDRIPRPPLDSDNRDAIRSRNHGSLACDGRVPCEEERS